MKQLTEFKSFTYHDYTIVSNLSSAQFHFESGVVTLKGVAAQEEKEDIPVEIRLDPENTSGFDVSLSASNGNFTDRDFQRKVSIDSIVRLDSGADL